MDFILWTSVHIIEFGLEICGSFFIERLQYLLRRYEIIVKIVIIDRQKILYF